MRVVVITGSRDWAKRAPIERVLAGAELLVVGDGKGADRIALDVAMDWDIIPAVYCASSKRFGELSALRIGAHLASDWAKRKRRAGPERNAAIARRAFEERQAGHDVQCYAFPLLVSPGTADCVSQLRGAGFDVTVF